MTTHCPDPLYIGETLEWRHDNRVEIGTVGIGTQGRLVFIGFDRTTVAIGDANGSFTRPLHSQFPPATGKAYHI